MSSSKKEKKLRDGIYAFTTNKKNECVHMIYNPGKMITEDKKRKPSFNTEHNEEISGREMKTTFVKLQKYCEDQEYFPDEWITGDIELTAWFPAPTSYEMINGIFYVLSQQIVASIYGKLYNYSDLLSHLQYYIDKDFGLITDINGQNITDKSIFYIDRVDIHPEHRGKKMCKPSLKFFLSYLINHESIDLLLIHNASIVMDGLPACYCYLKAGEENGLILLDYIGKKITSDKCSELMKKKFKVYYYVLSTTFLGSMKKRKKKTKKIKRLKKKKNTKKRKRTKNRKNRKKTKKRKNRNY